MRQMDMKAARENVIMGDAFIPGNFEDIVRKTKNKKEDLQDYLTKIIRKERFYRVKTDYLAKDSVKQSNGSSKKKKTKGGKSASPPKKTNASFASF